MGFLKAGEPLTFPEMQAVTEYVKHHGMKQLLYLLKTHWNRHDNVADLKWGDEVEYTLLAINNAAAKLYCGADEVLEGLNVCDAKHHVASCGPSRSRGALLGCGWHPEFGNHMVESYPDPALSFSLHSIPLIESSMRLRRRKIQGVLNNTDLFFERGGVFVCSLSAFPRFGVGEFATTDRFTQKAMPPPGFSSVRSSFVPFGLYTPHPRFPTLVAHVRERRGAKTQIAIPVMKDERTGDLPVVNLSLEAGEETFWPSEALSIEEAKDRQKLATLSAKFANPIRDHIYMDDFSFGMGQSCVQMTFGTRDVGEARWLYDQLGTFAPLLLALTASTPFQRGFLADTDTRWSTLEQAVDCRREDEMESGPKQIPKSRYSGFSLYLDPINAPRFNDTTVPKNPEIMQLLLDSGLDQAIADHYSHLWIRDPLVVFGERVMMDDETETEHFENIQSTNWNSVRFKPPPVQSAGGIGWRVELRTAEAQVTDFENAAAAAFAAILAEMLLESRRVNEAGHEELEKFTFPGGPTRPKFSRGRVEFYQRMSLNDENMHRAWNRQAVTAEKFWWPTEVFVSTSNSSLKHRESREMTLKEILCHEQNGLLTLCSDYVSRACSARLCSPEVERTWAKYAHLFRLRVEGKLMTDAMFFRQFVCSHPEYYKDSVVTRPICRDLSALAVNVGFGTWVPEALLGPLSCYVSRTASSGSATPDLSGRLIFSRSLFTGACFSFLPPCHNSRLLDWSHVSSTKGDTGELRSTDDEWCGPLSTTTARFSVIYGPSGFCLC